MKSWRTVLMLLVVAVFAAGAAPSQGKSHPGFERLKSLVGSWEGKNEAGQPVKVSFRLASGGTVLLETLDAGEGVDMVTVYHVDGDRLMLTHYCAANNQPRMRAENPSADAKSLDFAFVDGTNLPGSSAGHMHRLSVTFDDADRFTQNWTWREDGKDKVDVMRYQRKK